MLWFGIIQYERTTRPLSTSTPKTPDTPLKRPPNQPEILCAIYLDTQFPSPYTHHTKKRVPIKHFQLYADAVGQMKKICESIIKGQRAKLEVQFVANVGSVLGAKVVIEGLPAEDMQAALV